MQPYDVRITFTTTSPDEGGDLLATIVGRFTLFDAPDAASASQIVLVRGRSALD